MIDQESTSGNVFLNFMGTAFFQCCNGTGYAIYNISGGNPIQLQGAIFHTSNTNRISGNWRGSWTDGAERISPQRPGIGRLRLRLHSFRLRFPTQPAALIPLGWISAARLQRDNRAALNPLQADMRTLGAWRLGIATATARRSPAAHVRARWARRMGRKYSRLQLVPALADRRRPSGCLAASGRMAGFVMRGMRPGAAFRIAETSGFRQPLLFSPAIRSYYLRPPTSPLRTPSRCIASPIEWTI